MAFSDLPREVHLQILHMLNYKAFSFLRATNKYFYELSSDKDIIRVLALHENDDCVADFYGQREYLPCYTCLRMLPEIAFERKQIRFTRAYGHKDYKKRRCFQCGLRSDWKVSQKDPILLPDGSYFRFCQRCHCGEQTKDHTAPLNHNGFQDLCAKCRIKDISLT